MVTEGNRNIVISLPGENRDLTDVGSAAELRFRKVLKAADGSGAAGPARRRASATPGAVRQRQPGPVRQRRPRSRRAAPRRR